MWLWAAIAFRNRSPLRRGLFWCSREGPLLRPSSSSPPELCSSLPTFPPFTSSVPFSYFVIVFPVVLPLYSKIHSRGRLHGLSAHSSTTMRVPETPELSSRIHPRRCACRRRPSSPTFLRLRVLHESAARRFDTYNLCEIEHSGNAT
ncbi:hypothetical protein PYCCODRAFT_157211 [Trametes coccinea BRFM310]|uniref:Uncharacterized protein n=1 Tax=Trametes coccinea (strain BRFM310) TaxID=1353009 RepID=A0A1Y2IRZ3_TRAC3|nr:hypothetical protein PYCCODRAFT_157211 [Trametes coccinea BRFM310]